MGKTTERKKISMHWQTTNTLLLAIIIVNEFIIAQILTQMYMYLCYISYVYNGHKQFFIFFADQFLSLHTLDHKFYYILSATTTTTTARIDKKQQRQTTSSNANSATKTEHNKKEIRSIMKHQVKSIIKYCNLCLAELEYGLESEDFQYRNGVVYNLQWLNVTWSLLCGTKFPMQ